MKPKEFKLRLQGIGFQRKKAGKDYYIYTRGDLVVHDDCGYTLEGANWLASSEAYVFVVLSGAVTLGYNKGQAVEMWDRFFGA